MSSSSQARPAQAEQAPVRSSRARPARARRTVGALLAVLALAVAAGCNRPADANAQWQSGNGGGGPSGDPSAAGAAQLVLTPGANAKNVSPVDPVKAELANGTLDKVTLTNSANKVVEGSFDADKRVWQSTEELGYNKTYKLVASGTTADGAKVENTSTFTTVKPKNLTLPYLRANTYTLLDGKTFGVGQVVIIWFDEPIANKAAAEKQLTVTADPPIEGSWHWFGNRELHWRPQAYWPAGTKVTVDAKVYGHDLGGGLYGERDVTANFTIGHDHRLVADSKTFHMKVYVDGKQVTNISGHDVTAGIPISMGKSQTETDSKGNTVDYRTHSGVHVMMERYDVKEMKSCNADGTGICDPSSPNYYVSKIPKAIRISASGEFVHKRDWTVWQMGKMNTSHGCINVGSPYIDWIYANFIAGDVVDVKNTGKMLPTQDGLGDWNVAWADWVKGSALS